MTADQQGNLYVLHRPTNGNPVVGLDAQGNLLRSWGKGMFNIPHGIRLDPDGNVWTGRWCTNPSMVLDTRGTARHDLTCSTLTANGETHDRAP